MHSKLATYDLIGRLIYKSSNSRGEELLIITSPTTKGIYIGKVESQEDTQTIKFFVP